MGVLVGDTVTFQNGLSLSNFIVSIKGVLRCIMKMPIQIIPGNEISVVYRITYLCNYYANQTAYNNSAPFHTSLHELDLTEAEITGNLFDAVYANIKAQYALVTDI